MLVDISSSLDNLDVRHCLDVQRCVMFLMNLMVWEDAMPGKRGSDAQFRVKSVCQGGTAAWQMLRGTLKTF